ncbi:hypothetical protein MHBO_005238 [Bonamia ostreae]|uniref:Uncharacterized protein n=1 Tax=Bonamia ostreae TaxID=126728 RepID=A0ABV2AVC8_9EUKA
MVGRPVINRLIIQLCLTNIGISFSREDRSSSSPYNNFLSNKSNGPLPVMRGSDCLPRSRFGDQYATKFAFNLNRWNRRHFEVDDEDKFLVPTFARFFEREKFALRHFIDRNSPARVYKVDAQQSVKSRTRVYLLP